jgi:hypothetical protein
MVLAFLIYIQNWGWFFVWGFTYCFSCGILYVVGESGYSSTICG